MTGEILEMLRKITIFMICIRLPLYFGENNSGGKYLQLLLNLLILLQIAGAAGALFSSDRRQMIRERYVDFQERLERYLDDASALSFERYDEEEGVTGLEEITDVFVEEIRVGEGCE
ncbi:MAG: hypothetical protein J5898_01205 [Lachnospiraceae bacterium]|nr:hypothetical protein [Lachnospiraceae bacterium]